MKPLLPTTAQTVANFLHILDKKEAQVIKTTCAQKLIYLKGVN